MAHDLSCRPVGQGLAADADAGVSAQGACRSTQGRPGDRIIAKGLSPNSACCPANKGALTVVLDKASRQGS
jgi:hypothetical protein